MVKFLLGLLFVASASFSFAQSKDIPESSLPVDNLRVRCDQGVVRAEEYFENGQTNDQEGFLALSKAGLETCRLFAKKSGGWSGIASFISTGKRLCHQSSNQRSPLHQGACLLKLSQTVRAIVL